MKRAGGGSWNLFQVRGIPVRAHITLLIAIPYFALVIGSQLPEMAELAMINPDDMRLPGAIWGILLAIGLFGSVTLHELGHAFFALREGRRVRSVTLMLLGGSSHIDAGVKGEAKIAVIGPIVSFIIGFLLIGIYRAMADSSPDLAFGAFYLGQINLTIAIFNLLPAFPLDGGRLLRAGLSRLWGSQRGTVAAVWVGRVFAAAFVGFGLVSGNLILLLIGLFIFAAGAQELQMLRLTERLKGLTAGDLMHSVPTLSSGTMVDAAIRNLKMSRERSIPVVYQGDGSSGELQIVPRFVGLADEETLEHVPEDRRSAVPVGLAANHDVPALRKSDAASAAVEALAIEGEVAVVVGEHGEFEGVIDREDVLRKLSRAA